MTRLLNLAAHFDLDGEPVAACPHGRGHIHDTYRMETRTGSAYILQRFNWQVFPRPEAVAGNIQRVTTHLRRLYLHRDPGETDRRTLTPIPTRSGGWFHTSEDGALWRSFLFIRGSKNVEEVSSPRIAFQLGRAFGEFQRGLADLPGSLEITIPGFHDTGARYRVFLGALESAPQERTEAASGLIELATEHAHLARRLDALKSKDVPVRPVHNDAKVDNLLLDAASGEALCVIDLDTVMPGYALFDFGDMVRSGCSTAPEEAAGDTLVGLDLARFKSLTVGYLSSVGDLLTDEEKELLVFGAQLLTYETALRFLTDYLQGDVYFKTSYGEQNLDRARNQFQLLVDMVRKTREMAEIVSLAA